MLATVQRYDIVQAAFIFSVDKGGNNTGDRRFLSPVFIGEVNDVKNIFFGSEDVTLKFRGKSA